MNNKFLSLFFSLILIAGPVVHGKIVKSPKSMTIKCIGYTALDCGPELNKLVELINKQFSASLLSELNEEGIIKIVALTEKIDFKKPDPILIKKLCEQYGLDGILLAKLKTKVEEETVFQYKLNYVSGGNFKIFMSLLDKNGNSIKSVSFSPDYRAKTVQLDLSLLVTRGTSEVVSKLSSIWRFGNTEFNLNLLQNKIWRSFKTLGKDGIFEHIHIPSRVNICFFKNSDLYFEYVEYINGGTNMIAVSGMVDTTIRKPGYRYTYSAKNKKLILNYGETQRSYKVSGYNGEILILQPLDATNAKKIYFEYIPTQNNPKIQNP